MTLVSKKLAKRTKKKPKIIRRKTRKRAKISQKVRKRRRNRMKKNKTRMMLNSRDCMEWAEMLNPTKLQLTRARMIRTRK